MILTAKSNKPLHPIGIGTWGISSQRTQTQNEYAGVVPRYGDEDVEIEALRYSLTLGQNHLDCAELYGGFYTDEVVGKAISGWTREDLFIADKLWRHSVVAGQVRPTVERMLNKLQTTYLDMLYIHAPWPNVPWQEAIPQIDELIDKGTVHHLAVSNFGLEQLQQAQALTSHRVAAIQTNYNALYKAEVSSELRAYCQSNDIAIIPYQPIKRGEVFANTAILQIAQAHDATASQVALAWLLQQDMLPIPKATTKQHIDDNLASLNVALTNREMTILNNL